MQRLKQTQFFSVFLVLLAILQIFKDVECSAFQTLYKCKEPVSRIWWFSCT